VVGWLALAALVVLLVPLFLCMPLTPDVAFYDICARAVLRGSAPEKDFLFLPPPGMPWALAGVRTALGWSSIAVRAADLLLVSLAILLLTCWLAALGLSRANRLWVAAALFAFYLTTTEWCHCQPDVWMFVPAVAALHLRRRQVLALTPTPLPPGERGRGEGRRGEWTRRTASFALLEGLLWGAACLIKPFVVVPGVLAWLASAALLRATGLGWWKKVAADAACLLAGGLLMGALWQGWLLGHGTWHTYWSNYADFRGDYYAESWGWQKVTGRVFTRMEPWGLLHVFAIPFAALVILMTLGRALVGKPTGAGGLAPGLPLLSAFYLGWVYQANYVQSQFNYHLAPTMLLAITLLAGAFGQRSQLRWARCALVAFATFAALWQPAFAPARLAVWPRCWREGSSTELRDLLSLDSGSELGAGWRELDNVAGFLREKQVGDGDVMCYNLSTIHLYLQLGVEPSTRYLMPEAQLKFFPQHRQSIRSALKAGPQRFVVTDLRAPGLDAAQAAAEQPGRPLALPPDLSANWASSYPFTEPVLFRAGRYYVHQASGTDERERHR